MFDKRFFDRSETLEVPVESIWTCKVCGESSVPLWLMPLNDPVTHKKDCPLWSVDPSQTGGSE